jgi:SAM-dependent methyltransferase
MLRGFMASLEINSSRKYLDDFAKEAASSISPGALVLDAAAGSCLYKHHFSHGVYESADFCGVNKRYGEITYACDLTRIPVEDSRYDLVFFSQGLEHVPEPKSVLNEIHRVLKPSGELWLSAPLFYEEHEVPYDFYRYTRYGFTYLLESTGFKVRRIEWLEGYYGTLSYQLNMAVHALPRHPKHYGNGFAGLASAALVSALKPLLAMSSILFSRLDMRNKFVSAGQCKNYAVVATKEVKDS